MAKDKKKQPAKEASQKPLEEKDFSFEEQTGELSDDALESVSGGSVVSELFKLFDRHK